MSIFSRLFQKNADGEGENPNEAEGSASAEHAAERTGAENGAQASHRPNAPSPEGRGTMRPTAPDLQLPGPIDAQWTTSGRVARASRCSEERRRCRPRSRARDRTERTRSRPSRSSPGSYAVHSGHAAADDAGAKAAKVQPPPRAAGKPDPRVAQTSANRSALPTVPEPSRPSSSQAVAKQEGTAPSAPRVPVGKKTLQMPAPVLDSPKPTLSLQLSDADMGLGAPAPAPAPNKPETPNPPGRPNRRGQARSGGACGSASAVPEAREP